MKATELARAGHKRIRRPPWHAGAYLEVDRHGVWGTLVDPAGYAALEEDAPELPYKICLLLDQNVDWEPVPEGRD